MLEKHKDNSATLHFHSKITSDNRDRGGIYPIIAHESHQKTLSNLVNEALRSLPVQDPADAHSGNGLFIKEEGTSANVVLRKKPDFVTATRGPGMRASLITGVDTAKGLAVGWQVPFLGVNHMQAHALTSRLVSALDHGGGKGVDGNPAFPFLTLLVSGGHTMLVHSKGLCDHEILADTVDLALGDMLDKCGRDILPAEILASAENVMYARLLESFAFPEADPDYTHVKRDNVGFREGYKWVVNTPYNSPGPGGKKEQAHKFSFAGMGSYLRRTVEENPSMDEKELRALAREGMRVAFQHLASRILYALDRPDVKGVKSLVVSGGVACNKYLKHVLRASLDDKGYETMALVFPPPKYCTDNAAMIAWTGIEMWEAGWRTDLGAMAVRKWTIDPKAEDGGILGLDGWLNTTAEENPVSSPVEGKFDML